jgi:hypothetical protein
MTPFTTIPGLPAAVDRRVKCGRKLNVAEIAREADCSGWAVRNYLRQLGLKGPPRPYKGPPRTRRPAEDEIPPTPDQVRERAAEIRRENMAKMAAWVYRWPDRSRCEIKVYRHPKGVLA